MTKVKFKNIDAFAEWYLSADGGIAWLEDSLAFRASVQWNDLNPTLSDLISSLFRSQRLGLESGASANPHGWLGIQGPESIEKLKQISANLDKLSQKLDLIGSTENLAIIGTPDKDSYFLLPNYRDWLEIYTLTDYTNTPFSQLKSITASVGTGNIALISGEQGSLTIKSLKDREDEMKEEIKKVASYQTDELAALKRKLDDEERALQKRRQDMMATMESIKDKLEDGMRNLQKQIFLIETEIYGIQCFFGETISFTKLRSGVPAPDSQPVILMQKVRFLDEELGRMASLYNIDGEDNELFEEFLTHREDAVDFFCPSNKSVSLVRISRHNQYFGRHEKFENMLSRYKLYHGTQIGILIRNGENLYAGWTDVDKINIPDDFFLTPGEKILTEDDLPMSNGSTKSPSKKEIFEKQMSGAQEVASRFFLFNLLQGAISSENRLLTFDEKIVINKPSPKVIFSTADNWLEDNRYGQFHDIVRRCNAATKKDDFVLSVQRLRPDSYRQISNDRGIGYADRTHDCSISDNTIYNINLITVDKHRFFYWLDANRRPYSCRDASGKLVAMDYSYRTSATNSDPVPMVGDKVSSSAQDTFVREEVEFDCKYYVSVEKEYSFTNARSNFLIKKGEFINLTYMNSEWLKYAITTKKVNGWEVGGKQVDFAYLIPYLNKALDFVKTREITEESLIAKHFTTIPLPGNWMVSLSEWKLEQNVRVINDFQAKRFAKWLSKKI